MGGVTFGGESNGGDSGDDPNEEMEPSQVGLVCTISMGGENVTTESFDIATGEILIEEVTGAIVVTVEDSEIPHE